MAERPSKSFYITTPIYYVNDVPHIGHAYTTIIADAVSRYKKQAGCEVFFLTGTDEHGQKVEKSASQKGLTPKELADKMVVRFKDLWKALNIQYDHFIRTTDPHHEQGVQKLFQKLRDNGDIYKGTYKGFYCVSDENFLSEDVPLTKKGAKTCPDCGKEAVIVSEECYFFKLSAYQDRLLEFYDRNPDSVRPQSRKNEVISFVKQGLKDLSITRTTVKWGIPVPDDPDHTIYVWFDALHNYMTGAGFEWDTAHFDKFWPADVHLIGKDILRFHAIFWPAFLMAAGFSPPKTVFGHGWWLKDETKMSKSKGNVLDPHVILNVFGADPLRYFLLREIPIGLDGNFSHEGFIHRINSDLANDLGNLVQRTLAMIHQYFQGKMSEPGDMTADDKNLVKQFERYKTDISSLYEDLALNKALEEIWSFINVINKYLADQTPWKLAKDKTQTKRLARVLLEAASAIRAVSFLLYPVMPETSEKIWQLLGEDRPIQEETYAGFDIRGYKAGLKTQKPAPLFPRVDLKEFLKEEKEKPSKSPKEKKMPHITFDEFKRMDLRVAEIKTAERVEGTQKLLKLEVDIGNETRQLVAGVAEEYSPEALIGKKLIVIVNLAPAVIRGVESQGMLLAAEDQGKAIIPFFTEDVPAGAKVK